MTIDALIGRQAVQWVRGRESGILHAANILFLGGEHEPAEATHVLLPLGLLPPIFPGLGYRGRMANSSPPAAINSGCGPGTPCRASRYLRVPVVPVT
jgi:hypothetical protein